MKPKGSIAKIDTTVIICSATTLFRMKTFGPKSLFSCDNKKLISHQIDIIRSINHNTDIVVTVGHMADRVIKSGHDIRFIENQLYETSGISEEIRLALNAVTTEYVIVVDGDILFNTEAFKCVFYNKDSALLEDKSCMPDEEPGMIVNKDLVLNLAYDLSPKWGQMCMLSNNELRLAKKILGSRENGHLLFHEIINSIISSGGKFRSVGNKDVRLQKINNPKVLKNARSHKEIQEPIR